MTIVTWRLRKAILLNICEDCFEDAESGLAHIFESLSLSLVKSPRYSMLPTKLRVVLRRHQMCLLPSPAHRPLSLADRKRRAWWRLLVAECIWRSLCSSRRLSSNIAHDLIAIHTAKRSRSAVLLCPIAFNCRIRLGTKRMAATTRLIPRG